MRRTLLLAVAVLFMANTAVAQQAGYSELRGSVVDEQGLALPGVTVVATHDGSGKLPPDCQ